jgi:hypothetical protein
VSESAKVFCEWCGAENLPTANHCIRCGRATARGQLVSQQSNDDDQRTVPLQPLQPQRRFNRPGKAAPPPAKMPQTAAYTPPPQIQSQAYRGRRGPGGCFLGFLAFLIIAALAAFFVWTVVKPDISDRVQKELDRGIATQVAAVDIPRLTNSGQIVLTEEEINRDIASYAAAYDPIKNVKVTMRPGELKITFELYGVSSNYRGDLAVDDGRIVVVDPKVSGPAGQLLDARDVAELLEAQLAVLMDRANVEPTSVRLSTGQLTVTTEPVS